jgi:hypothetical protein
MWRAYVIQIVGNIGPETLGEEIEQSVNSEERLPCSM